MKFTIRLKGGAGSGFYGHKGRKGQEGGSLPRGESQSGELSDSDRREWSFSIARSDLFRKIITPDGYVDKDHEEISDIMQQFPYGLVDKQQFVDIINNRIKSAEVLPKAKKPSKNQNWVFETPEDQMPPEIMYYLKQHYEKHGSGSQIIHPSEFREYSGGWLDERTLDHIYSESLRPYFGWEHMANLNQLRLSNKYVFSSEGITDKSARLGKSLKFLGLTPAKLYDELMKLKL
jgi:hypothetical protein